MRIAIVGPTHKDFISKLLPNYEVDELPDGYFGAPFLGIIIEEFLKRGHEVSAITTSKTDNKNVKTLEFCHLNFKWIVVPARKNQIRFDGWQKGSILDFFAYERRGLRNAILSHDYDLIHAHWAYEFAGSLKGINIPQLITIHDNPYKVFKYSPNLYRLGRLIMSEWVLYQAKNVSTVSPYMLNYAKSKCKSVRVIPNPTSLSSVKTIATSKSLEAKPYTDNPKLIMIMNGWDRRKNGEVGLKCFKEVRKQFPRASLSLFGLNTHLGGPANQSAISLEVEGINFFGPVSHDILLNHLTNSHILLHPALEESFGVVLIEAMARHVLVIGGNQSGAVPWVLDDVELLVDVNDHLQMSARAIKFLKDKNRYSNVTEKSFQNVIKRFSSVAVANEYEDYYKEIVKS